MENDNKYKFYSNPEYLEYLIEYRGDFLGQMKKVDYALGNSIDDKFGLVSVQNSRFYELLNDVPAILFVDFRTMFVLESIKDLKEIKAIKATGTSPENTGTTQTVKNNTYLNLTGSGVLVGMIDTGIDYLNSEFINADDTTRIESIWDQTIYNDNKNEEGDILLGSVYNSKQINKAIAAKNSGNDPYKIVPSKDTNGHGTQMASIIGASGNTPEVKGIANDCKFVVVKLIESAAYKKIMIENGIDTPVYGVAELVASLEYLYKYALRARKPIVIFVGIGSTECSHDGTDLLARYTNDLALNRGLIIVTGTGNEGSAEGHVTGYLPNVGDINTSELLISKEIRKLSFKVWISKSNKMYLNVISPSGQSSKFIAPKMNQEQDIIYILEKTELNLKFYVPDNITGLQAIRLDFTDIKPGIWKIQLKSQYSTDGRFDIWLPPHITLPEGTKFLNSNPYNTLTTPSLIKRVVSVAFYNQNTYSIVSESGKGYPLNSYIKPDIAAPGINILATTIGGDVRSVSGSSVAAAIVVGNIALLLQWGIIDNSDPTMFSVKIISYLIAGAKRRKIDTYPNQNWGYGIMDLEGVFKVLSGTRSSTSNYMEYSVNNLYIRIPNGMEV